MEMQKSVSELTAEIDNLTAQLEARDGTIEKLTAELGECDAKLKERDRKITKLAAETRRLTALLGDRDSRLRQLSAELAKCDATIRIFTVELGERHTRIGQLNADIGDYDRQLRQREAQLEERDARIRENEAEIRRLSELLEERESEIQELKAREVAAEAPEELNESWFSLDSEEELNPPPDDVAAALGDRDKKIEEIAQELAERSARIEELAEELGARDARIGSSPSPSRSQIPGFLDFSNIDPNSSFSSSSDQLCSALAERDGRLEALAAELAEHRTRLRKCFAEHPKEEEKMADVTLDPDTAHPRLVLSQDQKSVRWEYVLQEPPSNPQRFDSDPCVLGREAFTSGRHCWVVDVAEGQFCAVGVTKESLRRKGPVNFNPEEGIWALQQWGFKNRALTDPPTLLDLPRVPRRIRISLDYDWGEVTFSDVDNKTPIFTFPPASFAGERVRPWFWVELGALSLVR
ncbi:tripartite motif-containing protein 10-like [Phaenicophaeus curvirostris]|uniref:tripartite motif-containing protein 10-like n=1 Tax=Phaenicophaeus curvirostris TaxID=33595 RepID=UPI0037F0FC50